MNITNLSLFVVACFSADSSNLCAPNSTTNLIDSSDSLPLTMDVSPEVLHPFLQSFETWRRKKVDYLLSFGLALGTQSVFTTCGDDELNVQVSKEKSLNVINAEYPKPTDQLTPFYRSFHIAKLLQELTDCDSLMSLANFREVMSKWPICNTTMFSIDLAILRWLGKAIRINPNVKVDPSFIRPLSSLILDSDAREHCTDDIIVILTQVQRMIDFDFMSREHISPLLTLLSAIPNDDGLIVQKLMEISNVFLIRDLTF